LSLPVSGVKCRGAVEVVVDVISHPWEDAVGGPPGREAHGCDPTVRTLELPQGSMSFMVRLT
ncbi:hypothetical protein J6590_081296, partial [Homalodisca vitripennis]